MIALLGAFALLVAYLSMNPDNAEASAGVPEVSAAPASSQGRRAFRAWVASLAAANGCQAPAPGIAALSDLETAGGTSTAFKTTNSLTNRHEGSGTGEWTHKTITAGQKGDEVLRVYDSPAQSLRDFNDLLSKPVYVDAKAAAGRGDVDGFFVGLVTGNGKTGYVGQVYVNDDAAQGMTTKAANYLRALRNIAAEGY